MFRSEMPCRDCLESNFTLQKYGLKVLPRDPYAFTPLLDDGQRGRTARSLLLGNNMAETQTQIAQFSAKDAQVKFGNCPQKQRP